MNRPRFSSRKFIAANIAMFQATLVPILFKYMSIDDNITIATIGIIASCSAVYGITNIVEAKRGE